MNEPADELQRHRHAAARLTPDGARREADIRASLQAFDALHARRAVPAARRERGGWPLARFAMPGAAMAAALLLLALPWQTERPAPPGAPPASRMALPAPPPSLGARSSAPSAPEAAPMARDAIVLAAFATPAPQYFTLPWSRRQVLALLKGKALEAAEGRVLLRHGRRGLALIAPPKGLSGARLADATEHDFAVGLAGLLLLSQGEALRPGWDEPRLRTAVRAAAAGHAAREAALAALLPE